MIPLSRPDITEKEIRRVNAVLRSPYLSGGTALKEFEAKAARVAGTKYAVGVSSGTAALHLILLALGIGAGDEVITTPFSFVASANCILYAGAKPVFADIDPETLNLDPKEAEARITPRTKAILVVHVFGFPAAMDEFRRIAAENGVFLIEDACEAIGARWRGEPAGGLGTMGAFAFYPNKQVTTGEGGMVVTNEEGYAELVRSLSNQGRRPNDSWLTHERLGYNYRLDELSAALGCANWTGCRRFWPPGSGWPPGTRRAAGNPGLSLPRTGWSRGKAQLVPLCGPVLLAGTPGAGGGSPGGRGN